MNTQQVLLCDFSHVRKLNSVVPFDGANEAVAEESTKSTEDSTVLLPSLLCDAAASGDIAAIRHITESGAEHIRVDHHDYDMRTPLHLAVAEGHLEAVNLLLALGHEVWDKQFELSVVLDSFLCEYVTALRCHFVK